MRYLPILFVASLAACATPTGDPIAAPRQVDLGGPWERATTNGLDGTHGSWVPFQVPDSDDPGLELVDVAGHSDQEYNLTWSPDLRARDLDLEVRVQRIDGVEDQGGGRVDTTTKLLEGADADDLDDERGRGLFLVRELVSRVVVTQGERGLVLAARRELGRG